MVLLEEHVLRPRLADGSAMASQFGQLLAVISLPSMTLGIIPTDAPDRSRWVTESPAAGQVPSSLMSGAGTDRIPARSC